MNYKVLVAVTALSINCYQSPAQLIRSYGVKSGIARAAQDWTYSRSSLAYGLTVFDKSRMGLCIGGYVEWFNLPFISIISEIDYVQKGARDEFVVTTAENPDGTGQLKTVTPRIDYLSMPLTGKLRLETAALTFYAFGGPRIDFVVGRNEEGSGSVFRELKSPEFGISVGAGFDIPILFALKIGGEVRYSCSPQYAYSNQYLTVQNKSTEFLLTIAF